MMVAALPTTAVNSRRLLDRLDEMATIGAAPGGGVTRLAFSAEERLAKQLLRGWYEEAGLAATVDAAGNVVARLRGDGTASGFLATGSHVDTVVAAGRFDGAFGAVAAAEVAAVLGERTARLRHDIVFVGFANEEGARGAPGFTGSLAVAGRLTPAHLSTSDDEGIRLADRLRDGGGDPSRIADARWNDQPLVGFIELHVEQGPVLHASRQRLGVVTSCPGRIIVDATFRGTPNHAGTTPMDQRADALTAAAEVVLAVESLATSGVVQVATAGVLQIEPGVRNVVPGLARLGIDLRDGDDARLEAAIGRLTSAIEDVADRRGIASDLTITRAASAATCDQGVRAAIERAAGALGQPIRSMPSGAGHDAQIVALIGPVGMIFVPSVGGLSHCPQEWTEPADLVLGAELLLASLIELDAAAAARETT